MNSAFEPSGLRLIIGLWIQLEEHNEMIFKN